MKGNHFSAQLSVEDNPVCEQITINCGDDDVAFINYFKNRGGKNNHDQAKAYANLFSAAPELLDCLIDCIENVLVDFPDDDERKIKYKAAIAKATGQPITCENP